MTATIPNLKDMEKDNKFREEKKNELVLLG